MRPEHTIRTRSARGAALLDVVVALTLLLVAGAGLLALSAEHEQAASDVRIREVDTRDAAAQLEEVALWPAAELSARLGTTPLSRFRVEIALIAPSLYTIAVRDSGTSASLVRTTLYAPPLSDVPRP